MASPLKKVPPSPDLLICREMFAVVDSQGVVELSKTAPAVFVSECFAKSFSDRLVGCSVVKVDVAVWKSGD